MNKRLLCKIIFPIFNLCIFADCIYSVMYVIAKVSESGYRYSMPYSGILSIFDGEAAFPPMFVMAIAVLLLTAALNVLLKDEMPLVFYVFSYIWIAAPFLSGVLLDFVFVFCASVVLGTIFGVVEIIYFIVSVVFITKNTLKFFKQ